MVLLAVAFLVYSVVVARSGLQLYAKRLSILLLAIAIVVPVYSMAHLGTTVYSADNQRAQMLAALLRGDTATVTADPRVKLISGYIDLISDRPFLGYGTGFVTSRAWQDDGPHNMYLALWVENGVVGLSAYVMLLNCVLLLFPPARGPERSSLLHFVDDIQFFQSRRHHHATDCPQSRPVEASWRCSRAPPEGSLRARRRSASPRCCCTNGRVTLRARPPDPLRPLSR